MVQMVLNNFGVDDDDDEVDDAHSSSTFLESVQTLSFCPVRCAGKAPKTNPITNV